MIVPDNSTFKYIRLMFVSKRQLLLIILISSVALAATANKSKPNFHHYTPTEIADLLGWLEIAPPRIAMKKPAYCRGYYKNTPILLMNETLSHRKNTTTRLKADRSTIRLNSGDSLLQGHVEISQINRKLSSDKATITRHRKTHKISHVDLKGNVRIELPRRLILARRASVNMETHTSYISSILYRLLKSDARSGMESGMHSLDVWGAAQAGFSDRHGVLHLRHATYSTCPPKSCAWYLQASHVDLDPKVGWGNAYNAALFLHNMPVFYFPFIRFPLDARRKTGFLLPDFANSDKGGLELGLPFYWNIAPNMDLRLTSRYIKRRGAMFEINWRYLLTPWQRGNLHLVGLPKDRLFRRFKEKALLDYAGSSIAAPGLARLQDSNAKRGALGFKHLLQHPPHWFAKAEANLASDDYLFFDLNNLLGTEEIFHLRNSVDVRYESEHWNLNALFLTYQTLHPVNQEFVNDLYSQAPRLNVTSYYPLFHRHLNFKLKGEFVYFTHKRDLFTGEPIVTGSRFNLHPSLTFPVFWRSGFIVPRIETLGTYYLLEDQSPGIPSKIARILPIIDIDSSVYFDRYFTWGAHPFRQTLEPRLFYLLIPLHNQDKIPIFDTEVLPFSFAQLFRVQRFIGVDRLGDANQLSMALTSRLLDGMSGVEKIRSSIGVIYYFHRHRVCLASDCRRDPTVKNTFSPIIGELRYRLTPEWRVIGALAWDPSRRRTNNGYIHLQYRGRGSRTFYLTYRYIQNGENNSVIEGVVDKEKHNDLNRLNLALRWPLNRRWNLLASSSYNTDNGRQQAYYYGLQYNSCCWAIRFISHNAFYARRIDGSDKFQHSYYLQIQLKGLSAISSSDPGSLLEKDMPGYRNIFK